MAKHIPVFEMVACCEVIEKTKKDGSSTYNVLQVMDVGVNFEKFIGSDLVGNVIEGEKHMITFAPEMDKRNIVVGTILNVQPVSKLLEAKKGFAENAK